MKFRDIPQFTKSGSWECDFDLVHFVREIEVFEKEEGLILNPDFQRGHVWTEEQQIKYIEFILKGGKTARVVYLNNPTWYTQNTGTNYNDFVCVDGLQRITAIQRFIHNQIKVYNHYFNEYEDTARIPQGMMKININDLSTKKDVLKWYLEFNSGGTIHTEEEINKVKRLLEQEL
jgi:uncharacterized protein with ParB-like and HNH nuclease domain